MTFPQILQHSRRAAMLKSAVRLSIFSPFYADAPVL